MSTGCSNGLSKIPTLPAGTGSNLLVYDNLMTINSIDTLVTTNLLSMDYY